MPTTYAADDPGLKMTMRPVGDRRVVFEPYPFDKRGLKVQIAARRVPQASFENSAAFRRAFYQAEQSLLEYTLE